jgi:hypothetical protein
VSCGSGEGTILETSLDGCFELGLDVMMGDGYLRVEVCSADFVVGLDVFLDSLAR